MADQPGIEQFVGEQAEARFRENREIVQKLGVIQRELTRVTQEKNRIETELAALEGAFEQSQILEPQPKWLKPPRRKDSKQATLVTILSDVHGGERVEKEEMQGYNAYNLDICDLRLRRFFEKVIMLKRSYIAGVEIDGITLVLGGDLVSGTIHDELSQTNDLSTYDTALWLSPRLLAGIQMWAEEFRNVHVVSVPGNHGRDSKIPRFKQRSAHNADTLVAKILALQWKEKANVTFDIPEAFDANFEVYGFRFSTEHGDNMRFSGTSEIGALGPVKRGTLRKSRQRQQEGHPLDYLVLGHFHQYVPATNQGFVMNGSLVGYNEYARGWHFTPEPPQQALVVVTPEYGVTSAHPILVSKRSEENW